jgi:hypothetical protein
MRCSTAGRIWCLPIRMSAAALAFLTWATTSRASEPEAVMADLWDNRSVMHKANPHYDMNERRYLYD